MPVEAPTSQTLRPCQWAMGVFSCSQLRLGAAGRGCGLLFCNTSLAELAVMEGIALMRLKPAWPTPAFGA